METFNLQTIQETTCMAIAKKEWIKNIIQQIRDAAKKGETECEIDLKGTPADNIGDDYLHLVFFLTQQGFKLNENVKDALVVRWDFPNSYEQSPLEKIETAILHLVEVQCNMVYAICTDEDDEEQRKALREEMDTIIAHLPDII